MGSSKGAPCLLPLQSNHLLSDVSSYGRSVPLPVMLCSVHCEKVKLGSGLRLKLRLSGLVLLTFNSLRCAFRSDCAITFRS